jgi:subtilisin family serine protease
MLHLRAASPSTLTLLAAHPDVVAIHPDTRFARPAGGETRPDAPLAALATAAEPSGPTVALIDTGVDLARPDFGRCLAAGAPGCRVAYAAQLDGAGSDDLGHGTNLAAIIARLSARTRIASLDVFDRQTATTAAVLRAFDWCIANRDAYDLQVINLSLGAGSSTTPCPSEPLALAIQAAADAGIVTVVAAGNQGYTDALAIPACAPAALSVGAADRGRVLAFSNSASFLTLLAPGLEIDAGGRVLSGTSQAAAFVSGAAAALETDDLRRDLDGAPITDPRNGVATPQLRLPLRDRLTAVIPFVKEIYK